MKEKIVVVKWELDVVEYTKLISDLDDYTKKIMNITDESYCKMCALSRGVMCAFRSLCRCNDGYVFVNRCMTFVEEIERENI